MTLFDCQFVRKFPRRPTLAQGPNAKSHAPIGLLDVLGAAGPEAERTYGAAVMDTPECENGHSGSPRSLDSECAQEHSGFGWGRILARQFSVAFKLTVSSKFPLSAV